MISETFLLDVNLFFIKKKECENFSCQSFETKMTGNLAPQIVIQWMKKYSNEWILLCESEDEKYYTPQKVLL